ncbi:hypothetical protein F4820DRAFT_467758 [Hypoxylon rubiginosum]|uniref:Uncharacterized protein n=1 Tax=Hypoxylon rubiginosum TaxID=110542 RepID=A0ACB9Z8T2_9PEZI|nr:hypothetical protein F4820DRAFT_467758 [Hypoxylon rubiginosum]
MRFEDWDVLLFPRDSKIPMKEFKTNCHVVHDTEFAYTHGSFGLPTMTCFMPAMSPSTPFSISLHCWKTPDVSQFTKNYSKHAELVKFEARVLVDGRLVASSSFNRSGPWPQLISHSFEFTKNGDLETLRFPPFRSEVLRQSYWSPGDEVGRIKIVISEGFPRDSLTVPIERVKNVVAFSFQHAPLDILESSGIAWPNPGMWRRSANPTMPVPSQHHEDGPDAHLHSPRRRTSYMKGTSNVSGHSSGPPGLAQASSSNLLGSMPNTQAMLQRSGAKSNSGWVDPFNSQKSEATACFDWANNFGPVGYTQAGESGKSNYNSVPNRKTTSASRISRSDISMPDYSLSNPSNTQSVSDQQFFNLSASSLADVDASSHDPKAPTNTPTALVGSNFVDELDIDVSRIGTPGTTSMNEYFNPHHTNFSSELATSLTHSLLNQPHPLPVKPGSIPPAPEVKSRKESRLNHDSPHEHASAGDQVDMRKASQSYSNLGKENQVTSATHSPPSQSAYSGVFSNRSVSAGDFGNDLANVTNIFTQPTMDSQGGSNPNTDTRGMGGPEKSVKRTRHLTPSGSKVVDDDGKTLLRSPSVQEVLDDHFGAAI